jgi:hypothetical protein
MMLRGGNNDWGGISFHCELRGSHSIVKLIPIVQHIRRNNNNGTTDFLMGIDGGIDGI